MSTFITKTLLDNGLTVVTKEVHLAPVVSVQVWYRVGLRNELPGMNGISHQLEHMMFKGTTNRPIQFGHLFNALGCQFNAFTGYDETVYFATAERDKLEALLTLEADRMENSIVGIEQLKSEKRVVISELEGYENNPVYRLNQSVMKVVFPDCSYGLPVGGTIADLETLTAEQLQSYYQKYYRPDNTVLVITGDFKTESALESVQTIFGQISKRSPAIVQAFNNNHHSQAISSRLDREPIILREPGSTAILQTVYSLPNINHPDIPALNVMDKILTGGRSSCLYQALVESGLASSVSASLQERMERGWYSIYVTAIPGQQLPEINQVLQQSLVDLQQELASTEELNRAKQQLQATFIFNNQDITSQGIQLGFGQTVAGDYRYIERFLLQITNVTAADVLRVAQTYLTSDRQTIGFFEPTLLDSTTAISSSPIDRIVENFSPDRPLDPAKIAKYIPASTPELVLTLQPSLEQITLSNGLQVWFLPDSSTPTVNLSGYIDAGTGFDLNTKAGLASLTAANLVNGTQTRDALTLAKTIEDCGANLNIFANREGVNISGSVLASNLATLLEILADILQNATFSSQLLELYRQQALAVLNWELDDPHGLGERIFQHAIYPENHPFHILPTEESLKNITREDLVHFYRVHYRPDTTKLVLVGNFNPTSVQTMLETFFGKWQAQGKPEIVDMPEVLLPQTTMQLNRVISNKTEAVTYLGYNGISRQDSRFYAALVLNHILGGNPLSSRLGTEIRDRQGLTYSIYSAFVSGRTPGPFAIQMQTSPEDTQQAIASTIALLEQLKEGITEAELKTAKRSLVSSYSVDLANPRTLTDAMLLNIACGLEIEELWQFSKHIESVNMAKVQQAIEELIHPNNLVILTVEPDGK
jgi:zinc protease